MITQFRTFGLHFKYHDKNLPIFAAESSAFS